MEINGFYVVTVLVLLILVFYMYKSTKIEGLSNHIPDYKRGAGSRTTGAMDCMDCMDTCMELAMKDRKFNYYKDSRKCWNNCQSECS